MGFKIDKYQYPDFHQFWVYKTNCFGIRTTFLGSFDSLEKAEREMKISIKKPYRAYTNTYSSRGYETTNYGV